MIQRNRRSLSKRKLKKVRLRTLLLLSITLIFNTYAWFLYSTTVSANITAHVSAWSVEFDIDDDNVEREIELKVVEAYPGMPEYSKTVDVHNYGDEAVDLSATITGVRIFKDTYVVSEDGEEGTYTPQEIKEMLERDFPFHVVITQADDFIDLNGESSVTVNFSWEYEENTEETDTEYGINAYEFYNDENYHGEAAVSIILKVIATQHNRQI